MDKRTAARFRPILGAILVCLVAVVATAATSSSNNDDGADVSVTSQAVPINSAAAGLADDEDGDSAANASSAGTGESQGVPTPDRVTIINMVKPEVISVDKYVTILIYCIGFPGNILSFAVWVQKCMRHSSGCYLAALALDDFIFLSLHVVLELHMVWGLQLLNVPGVCQLFPVIFLAAQYLGPLLVLGFTTERYISICHPFKREKYCTVRRAKTVIVVLVVTALCLSGVQGYFYTMLEFPTVTDPAEGTSNGTTNGTTNGTITSVYECGPRALVSSDGNSSPLILWNLSIEILTFLLVPLTVLVLNILVICEMRRLSRMEQVTLHGHAQRTSATTVMLLAVSFYLILTTLPVTIAYTLFYEFDYKLATHPTLNETLKDPSFQRWVTYELVLASIKEFGTTQYAFNIIFYVITGKIFRRELQRLVVKVLCGKISLSISKRYSGLRSSIRRDGSRTASTWVSINGHTTTEKPTEASETNV